MFFLVLISTVWIDRYQLLLGRKEGGFSEKEWRMDGEKCGFEMCRSSPMSDFILNGIDEIAVGYL